MQELYALKFGSIARTFKNEGFSFWMICGYLFFEYVRPQSIITAIDFLPWTQIFILLSALGWVLDSKRQYVRNITNMWMMVFFAVILISSWQAYRPSVSFEGLEFFYTWLIIYFLIINIVTNEKRLFIFLLIFMIASFKLSLFGARTWAMRGFSFTTWGLMGPSGYFQNSGELAIQMLVFAGVSYYFLDAIKPHIKAFKKYTLLAFPVTAAMTVLGASSRGGQLALIAQILVAFWRKVSIRGLIIIVLVGAVGYQLLPPEQKQRFEQMGDDDTSKQRLLYWRNGMKMIEEHPWLGVGYFNYTTYYERYYPNDLLLNKTNAELPHNIFIQVGTDTGYIGLFVYGMLIWSHFRCNRKVRRIEKSAGRDHSFLHAMSMGLNIGFLGFLIAGQFVSVVYYPFMWINLALAVALQHIAVQSRKIENQPRTLKSASKS